MDIELDDLSHRSPATPPDEPAQLDVVSAYWAWTSAALLAVMSIALSVSPRVLLLLSSTEPDNRTELTDLESFLALHGSIGLLAVAASLVLNIPSTSPGDVLIANKSPPRHPFLVSFSVASCTSSFLAYNTSGVGPLSSVVTCGAGIMGIWGAWAAVFGDASSISRKTGADKHTSAFIFGNKSSASKQKKEWLRQQKRD
ncbi:hypothetical protein MKEN_01196900 [Mycena kentingensis (nom. inval.)]|nr:hypothetical protein MKEN_01196900 [Mycena kentingensis (nom. inval.)]